MLFRLNLFVHIIIAFFFSIVFLICSMYTKSYIDDVNNEKSIYPILVYLNTIDETEEAVAFIVNHDVFLSYQITNPDSLEKLIIQKYGFNSLSVAEGDFSFPFLLDIQIRPFPTIELMGFIEELSSLFPHNVIHYNESIWQETDIQVKKYKNIFCSIQIVALIAYLFCQILIRLHNMLKNRETINAILASGISQKKLAIKRFQMNIIFLIVSMSMIISINYLINFLFVHKKFDFKIEYFNIESILMLFIINIILIIFQKPVFMRRKYD